jgi:hypothetical protein
VDGALVEVTSARFDQGLIRATLTVRRDGVLLHRNTVNLTSARARNKTLAELNEKGIKVDEQVLVAFDEACRQPRPRMAGKSEVSFVPSGEAVDLSGLKAKVGRWLLIRDAALLPVFTGAVLAHRLGGESVWLMMVAPPGATKSELLRTLYGHPSVYPLSELTARTFASGLDSASGDPSLLSRLDNQILVLKDLTTVLEMARDERQSIFAQLREIYDGRFDKAWGTGREIHWEGRLGFLAGVTPIIDRHHAALSVLGERFTLLRPITANREELARQAIETADHTEQMRSELVHAMQNFLASRQDRVPVVGAEIRHSLARVADFVTRARSGVVRDGRQRDIDYAPEPEAPTRFAKVLYSLASGIAVAQDTDEVGDRELTLVLRVALDCLPVIRRRVIAALVAGTITDDGTVLSTTKISGATQFSTASIRRALEDLQALEVVRGHKAGQGKADEWELDERWVPVFQALTDPGAPSYFSGTPIGSDEDEGQPGSFSVTVPEMSEGLAGEVNAGSDDAAESTVSERFGEMATGSPALTAYTEVRPSATDPQRHFDDGWEVKV